MIFSFTKKIYGYECDIYGHLNNANYLQVFEAARSEVLNEIGLSIASLKTQGINIYLVKINIEYKKSIELEEKILILTKITYNDRLRAVWQQELYNSHNELCCVVQVHGVYVSAGKPKRISHELCSIVDNFVEHGS